ncbi:MAG: hypothetical protein A2033_01320 [Bacteroidetes bacterium GWA2_31_9]|nr:MAG: hypothetical protein A2033_01320 [Bacteroidetes bacterium GWA2_31_9]
MFGQNTANSYLDFFGKKYEFKNSILLNDAKYFKESQKELVKYKLCGKQFLNKKVEKHMSQKNMTYFINKTVYSISNCVSFYNLIDSVKIRKLDSKLDFKVVIENNNYKILGYKIVADSVDYEIAYTDIQERSDKNFMMYDVSSNEAKNQLISIFDELKNCSRLMLTGIFYFDKKDNREYFVRMDVLLYR